MNRPCTLWVDNDRVFSKLQRFRKGKCRVGINQKDADLWEKLAFYVARLGPLLASVGKVVSHQDATEARDDAEECFSPEVTPLSVPWLPWPTTVFRP